MYDGSGSLFALGVRLTKLDTVGATLVGAKNCYVTDSLITISPGLEYRDGAEAEQANGAGAICLYYKAPDMVKRGTIKDFKVCSPDPNIAQFAIGGDVITATGTAEVQTVTITGTPTGGNFTLTFDGQTTANIAYNAAAAAVQTALENLSNLLPGDVAVTGGPGPGTPWTVTFTIPEGNVPQMMSNGAGLTGGVTPAVTVATTTQGSALTDIGYRAPQVGINPTPNGLSVEFWTAAIDDGAYAADLPYFHWVLPRAYLRPSDDWKASGEDPMLPSFEGWCNQNKNWLDGPENDWTYPSDRVWQYARVATLPDFSRGFVAVT